VEVLSLSIQPKKLLLLPKSSNFALAQVFRQKEVEPRSLPLQSQQQDTALTIIGEE